VLFVHGPGGIGKSALLREIGRRARRHGRALWMVDGRLLLPSVDALTAALEGAADADRPVVLIDSFEQVEALAQALRDDVLPALPASAVVVLAGRRAPQPLWFRDGWEHLLQDVPLRALDDAEAEQLLAKYGIDGEQSRLTRIWGQGSPLALHVGASSGDLTTRDADDLARTVAHRLLGDEAGDIDPSVMAVAAIARAVDARLLGAVLPGRRSGRAAIEALQTLTVVESYGTRLALHDVVRAALRTDLRRRDSDLYRTLSARIADHLHDRIVAGESNLLDELADLVQRPDLRWSVGAGFGSRYRLDRPVAGDVELAADALQAHGTAWWPGVARYFTDAPAWITVIRDRDGGMAGFSIAVTPRNAPTWVGEDAVLGPWVEHARHHHPHGNVVIWRESHDLVAVRGGESSAEVNAILNLPGHLRDELASVQVLYGVVDSRDQLRRDISARVGAMHMTELDVQDGDRNLEVHVVDHGDGGLVGALRGLVHAEQGLPIAITPRSREAAVRAALRQFHDSAALAASPLAHGTSDRERAESVRAALLDGVERAFPPGDPGRTLLQRAYLDPDGGHHRAMGEALMSRTSYFRRLGEAINRLVTALDSG
jgi:hypothetical protein